jgi:hypothetical protein
VCSGNLNLTVRRVLTSLYVYWHSFLLTEANSRGSPARNVLSCVVPVLRFLILDLTKAAPLPGFTCRNSASTTVHLDLTLSYTSFCTYWLMHGSCYGHEVAGTNSTVQHLKGHLGLQ